MFPRRKSRRDPTDLSLKKPEDLSIRIDNAWAVRVYVHEQNVLDRMKPNRFSRLTMNRPAPLEHNGFCADNNRNITDIRKLIVRGLEVHRVYLWYNGNDILEDGGSSRRRVRWNVPAGIEAHDIIVYLDNFDGARTERFVYIDDEHSRKCLLRYKTGGLWLLRPTDNKEFKLVACLSWAQHETDHPSYDNWVWQPTPESSQLDNHRLWVEAKTPSRDLESLVHPGQSRTSTVV